jgi:hypothetical protein
MTAQTTPALSRRAFLQTATAALLSRSGRAWSAGPRVPVEDWRATLVGSTGVPPGWQKYETPGGHPAYDFTVVEADLAALPILAWQWRVLRLPQGADLRNRATSDITGHILAVWPRFPAFARSRLIGYVWDPTLPVGTVIPSRKTGTVTFIVARRGEPGLGQWIDERRDVADDYRKVFGEAPPPLPVLALSIDTNDTRSPAEAMFGRIELQSR